MISISRIGRLYLFYMRIGLFASVFALVFFVVYYFIKKYDVLIDLIAILSGLLFALLTEIVSAYYLNRHYRKMRRRLPSEHFLPETYSDFQRLNRELDRLNLKIEAGEIRDAEGNVKPEYKALSRDEIMGRLRDIERQKNELLINHINPTPSVIIQLFMKSLGFSRSNRKKSEQYIG